MARNVTVKNEKKLKAYLRKQAKQTTNDIKSDHIKDKRNKFGAQTS